MKLVCTKERKGRLTAGKMYDCLSTSREYRFYFIVDDTGKQGAYDMEHFVTLQQWRESRLGEIGL